MKIPVGSHIHLMGICGTAMGSLAGLLKSQGYRVTGSDQNVYPPMSTQLESLGIPIMQGYHKENLDPAPDLVIVGNVITRKHEEAVALLETDIPYTSLPKAMGEYLIGDRQSVCLAGTHGKTTCTAMAVTVAEDCAPGSGFMVGGVPQNFEHSFRVSENDYFILEADEYDTAFFDKVPKFIHYKPKHVILTSVEFDHADIYDDLDQVVAAFERLVKLIPEDGHLIANGDDKNIQKLLPLAKCKVLTYGTGDVDYKIVDRDTVVGRNQFSVQHEGKRIADLAIKSPGEYNAMNATAVFALSQQLGWSKNKALQALANFKGVKRRQEFLGEKNGVRFIEDFAHHPTAVGKTIQAIKEQYLSDGKGRLFALFEPRSATSRRSVFQEEYAEAFSGAEFSLISKPYDQSKIDESDRFSSEKLQKDLRDHGQTAELFDSVDDMVKYVKRNAQDGDCVLIMSNGAFDGIYGKLLS